MSNKKRILSGLLTLWLMGNLSYDHKVFLNYEIIAQEDYFARYSHGKVFIGSKEYINSLSNISDNDILIIDDLEAKDPDMKVLSSYRIIDSNIRDEILAIISEYGKMYSSKWNRSITSMRIEWFVHNILYYLNYKPERTRDVDFNNDDEKVYVKRIRNN